MPQSVLGTVLVKLSFDHLLKSFIHHHYFDAPAIVHVNYEPFGTGHRDSELYSEIFKCMQNDGMISEEGALLRFESIEEGRTFVQNFPTEMGYAGLYVKGELEVENFVRYG